MPTDFSQNPFQNQLLEMLMMYAQNPEAVVGRLAERAAPPPPPAPQMQPDGMATPNALPPIDPNAVNPQFGSVGPPSDGTLSPDFGAALAGVGQAVQTPAAPQPNLPSGAPAPGIRQAPIQASTIEQILAQLLTQQGRTPPTPTFGAALQGRVA